MIAPALIGPLFDLYAVRSITSGIRANRIAAGGVPGPLGTIRMPLPHTRQATPQPRIEPRWVHHPEPRIEPRQVHRPEPRVEAQPVECVKVEVESPARVWNELPPVQKSAEVVDKPHNALAAKYRPAVVAQGALIDQFL